MQQHYGIGADEIWAMSWRRFVTLFTGIFTFTTPSAIPEGVAESQYEKAVREARGASGEIQRSFDWDTAFGRPKSENREILTTSELMQKTRSGKKKDWGV